VTQLPCHLGHQKKKKKKKVAPIARAEEKEKGGGSNRRRMNEEKNEEKEAFSCVVLKNQRAYSLVIVVLCCVIHRLWKKGIFSLSSIICFLQSVPMHVSLFFSTADLLSNNFHILLFNFPIYRVKYSFKNY